MMKLWFMKHSFRVRVGCWGLGSPRFTRGWYVVPRWGISFQPGGNISMCSITWPDEASQTSPRSNMSIPFQNIPWRGITNRPQGWHQY